MSSVSRSMQRANSRKKGTFVPQKALRQPTRSYKEIIFGVFKLNKKLKETPQTRGDE